MGDIVYFVFLQKLFIFMKNLYDLKLWPFYDNFLQNKPLHDIFYKGCVKSASKLILCPSLV